MLFLLGEKSALILLQKALKLLFMAAKLFLTARAIKTFICACGKSLGMHLIRYLPSEKQKERTSEERIGVYARDKDEGREHHCEIPIINSARCTATVLHKPGLERTEEKNTYDIAHRECYRNKNDDAFIYKSDEVKKSDNGIKPEPSKCNRGGNAPGLIGGLDIFADRLVISSELLLASHTFKP